MEQGHSWSKAACQQDILPQGAGLPALICTEPENETSQTTAHRPTGVPLGAGNGIPGLLPLVLWGYRPEDGASLATLPPLVAWLLLWFCLIWAGSIMVSIPIWIMTISMGSPIAFIFALASFMLTALLVNAYFAVGPSDGTVWGLIPLPETTLQVGILLGTLVATGSLPSWVFLAATHLRRWIHRQPTREEPT